jgi:A/G-specific adenine glycosylase
MAPDDQEAVLSWGVPRLRDLPWRRSRDPWAILVSEVMLQQTQVVRVVPRYAEFVDRFPTAEACASASPGDVVRCWNGLGYNRRALRLHSAACVVVDGFGGVVPRTLRELRTLPGVGPYTARAIMAFAFEADAAVVETNVARTLARYHGHRLRTIEVQLLADAALPTGEAWAWNQALMDLGATRCTARRPRCGECPLAGSCRWRRAGWPEPDPALGSAGVSGGQSRFDGSDREGRGRLVRVLGHGPVPANELAEVMGWAGDVARAEAVAATVVADGLAMRDDQGSYRLP